MKRHAMVCALLGALAFAPLGCKRAKNVTAQQTAEEAPRLASAVQMGDPRAVGQLVSGFHGIENGSWRWTQKQFAVALGPPAGSQQKGAMLSMKLTVPPVSIEKLGSLTLATAAEGVALAPETYAKPGQYTLEREVPANVMKGSSVKFSFQLDKAMPPAGEDVRELGIIVTSVALESK